MQGVEPCIFILCYFVNYLSFYLYNLYKLDYLITNH